MKITKIKLFFFVLVRRIDKFVQCVFDDVDFSRVSSLASTLVQLHPKLPCLLLQFRRFLLQLVPYVALVADL